MNYLQDIEVKISELLQSNGLKTESFSIKQLKRTGNNRTYYIEANNIKYFAKYFFRDKDDLRDRFTTEWAFIKYAEKVAPGFTAKILYTDPVNSLVIYEFIQGQPFVKDQISEFDVLQAAAFLKQLNNRLSLNEAVSLPFASEACFSINDHLSLILNRIGQLANIPPDSIENVKALELVDQINETWNNEIVEIQRICKEENIDIYRQLDSSLRIISPSDFGFHNCLITENGKIVFLDFEYAGWDDSAKLVGDFFGQIQVPVPNKFFHYFIDLIFNDLPDGIHLKKRAKLLLNAFKIKWACIALNIFLPMHLNRRKFSNPDLDVVQLKDEQLQKATDILEIFKSKANVIY